MIDFVIIAVLAAAVFFAIRYIRRARKKGGTGACSGSCSNCSYMDSCTDERREDPRKTD